VAQYILIRALTEKNKKIIVAMNTYISLRRTLLDKFLGIMNSMKIAPNFKYNKGTSILKCLNTGSTIEFMGLQDALKIQGVESHIIVIDEAIQIKNFDVFTQLILRMTCHTVEGELNQFILMYNPSDRFHWIKTRIIDQRNDYALFNSSYKDNPYLSIEAIKEIEHLKEVDMNAYLCYCLGVWGDVRGRVFDNFEYVRKDSIKEEDYSDAYYGLDFGYAADPSVCVRALVNKKRKEMYVEEVIWRKGMTNNDLDFYLDEKIMDKNVNLVMDSAEPKSIEELRRLGWKNGVGVKKGAGSVNFGIQLMKGWKIKICKNSKNLIDEFENYRWLEDKSGVATNIPSDKFNHGIDALRYIFLTYLNKKMNEQPIEFY
jgi:phage terminase large subunit